MTLVLLACLWLVSPASGGDGFDWKRDRILLANGREERGVVIEAFDAEHVVLMRSAGKRDEIPRKDIERVELLRERLAGFMQLRSPGLSSSAEWSLVDAAQRAGLMRMARLQAYHVLTLDPEHAGAHEFLGHRRAGGKWKWTVDEKKVGRERVDERNTEWSERLILQSEHFVVETDCGLRRALDVLFDLEALYVWWMEHLGPELHPTEDVDVPEVERIVFEIHPRRDDPRFEMQSSAREAYYATSEASSDEPDLNAVRTYYTDGADRPERLFELATESLVYSLLVLGKTRERSVDVRVRRPSAWVERGLGEWVTRHCGGQPGHVEIRAPFQGDFVLDNATARLAIAPLDAPHPLLWEDEEVTELVELTYMSLHGTSSNVPRAVARVASFVAFLIEADPQVMWHGKPAGTGRAALWHYLREVYGTSRVVDRDAFSDGLGGAEVRRLEEPWKAWTQSFVAAQPSAR